MHITAEIYNDLLQQVSEEFYRRTGLEGSIDDTGELTTQVSNSDGSINPFVFQEDVDAGKNYVGEHYVDTGRYIYGSEINAILEKLRDINDENAPDYVEPEQLITYKEIRYVQDFLDEHSKMNATIRGNDCSGLCVGFCSTTCFATCTSCTDTCEGTCTENCQETCAVSCTGTCSQTCTDGCKATCRGGCKSSCTSGCTGCSGSCSSGCRGGCKTCSNACAAACQGYCDGTCVFGCERVCALSNAHDPIG